MPSSSRNSVLEHLRRALLRGGAGLGDGELLACFIEHHDEAAFAALMNRHGPMVWGVCRRLLSHEDAEDAFQATFLVLVRKAASIVPREMVGNWLYGVAHQTALQARRASARRRSKEKHVTVMLDPEAAQDDPWSDMQPVLDQELSRLPDKYRAVIILCDLESQTRKEVARRLRVPEGTVAGRLARARAMLAKRLTQRGFTLSGGALAAVLSHNVASASVPESVVAGTIRAASFMAAGQVGAVGPVSWKVAALVQGALKAMMISKLKPHVAVVVMLGLLTGGATVLTYRTVAAQPDSAPMADSEPKSGQHVTALVRQLGDPRFAVREAASKKLRASGTPALPFLRAALHDRDREIVRRAAAAITLIRADARDALAKRFDPKSTVQYDHPVWKHFVAIAGDTRPSREIFGRIIANKKWFRTLDDADADSGRAGHVYRVGIAEVFRDFGRDPDPNATWPCDRPEEVAYLLLLGTYPDDRPPAKASVDEIVPQNPRRIEYLGRGIIWGEGQILHAQGVYLGLEGKVLDTSKGSKPVPGPEGTDRVFFKLLAAWSSRRDPASDIFKKAKALLAGNKAKIDEGFIAWGKEVGGLKAGLGYRPGEHRAYHFGETVTLVVRVRNVSKKVVKFQYLKQYFDENPPTVTDANGKAIPQDNLAITGFHVPVEVSLAPGKEIELESRIGGRSGLQYELRPASDKDRPSTGKLPPFYVRIGKVRLQYKRVFGNSSSGEIKLDPALSKLGTGELELEIKSQPVPGATEKR